MLNYPIFSPVTYSVSLLFLANVQATVEPLQCYVFMGVGIEKWDDTSKMFNCTGEDVTCKIIIEPYPEDPMYEGYTAHCSNSWLVSLVACWNECRKNVSIGSIQFEEMCSYCCSDHMCNSPHMLGFPVGISNAAQTLLHTQIFTAFITGYFIYFYLSG